MLITFEIWSSMNTGFELEKDHAAHIEAHHGALKTARPVTNLIFK